MNKEKEEKIAEISVKDLNEWDELVYEESAIKDLFDELMERLKKVKKEKEEWWSKIEKKYNVEEKENEYLKIDRKKGELFKIIKEEEANSGF